MWTVKIPYKSYKSPNSRWQFIYFVVVFGFWFVFNFIPSSRFLYSSFFSVDKRQNSIGFDFAIKQHKLLKFFSDLSRQGFKGSGIDCASQLSITATMTTLWENSNSSSSSRCLRHMLTIYLLIFAGLYQLHEAGATTRKSLNCQVFTLCLIYNNTTEHRVLSLYISAYCIAICIYARHKQR